jgi:hypothetical protein
MISPPISIAMLLADTGAVRNAAIAESPDNQYL